MLVIDITLEPQYIPSILEGLTTSVSIMIGFTGTILAIMLQRKDLRLSRIYFHLVVTLLIISACLLVLTYVSLVGEANFQKALRYAMLDLILSYCTLAGLLNFLYIRIYEHE